MITTFELFESKIAKGTLIVVDVQEAFSSNFSEKYVKEVFKYCNKFNRVYQIWDAIDQNKPTYTFPNEYGAYEKTYGGMEPSELSEEEGLDCFTADVWEELSLALKNNDLIEGTAFKLKNGDLCVYIDGSHTWFTCPEELVNLFENLAGTTVTMIGGADNECLQDIYITAKVLGVNVELNNDYIYAYKYCPI